MVLFHASIKDDPGWSLLPILCAWQSSYLCDNVVIEELGCAFKNEVVQLNYLPNLLHQIAEKTLVLGDAGISRVLHPTCLVQPELLSLETLAPLCCSQLCVFGFNSRFSLPPIYRSQDKTFNKAFSEQNVEAEALPQKIRRAIENRSITLAQAPQKHKACCGSTVTC